MSSFVACGATIYVSDAWQVVLLLAVRCVAAGLLVAGACALASHVTRRRVFTPWLWAVLVAIGSACSLAAYHLAVSWQTGGSR